jgi:hypothetical protein
MKDLGEKITTIGCALMLLALIIIPMIFYGIYFISLIQK